MIAVLFGFVITAFIVGLAVAFCICARVNNVYSITFSEINPRVEVRRGADRVEIENEQESDRFLTSEIQSAK